ncbi:aldose 1-epimerase family protein [Herbiconiux sp. P18]|uniref:aldose 1-epimerase family protein n=1 Tax=Herbiconiux liangxiaofengii TaxID=3342795 RepID=UPI0035BA7559
MNASHRPLSGTRIDLEAGDYRASIASIGATLRMLQHRGRDLVVPFGLDELRPAYRGATLAPWPNRVVDGRYRFGGEDEILPLTEPSRGHALHGLAAWLDFAVLERGVDRVLLGATIEPQDGYPHRIELAVEYTLDEAGLRQTVTARNLSESPAPYGTGPHPYLVAGPGLVDDWTLELPASEVLTVTPDRLIPVAVVEVAYDQGGALDFQAPRTIGDTFIDHAFTGIARDADGLATVTVSSPEGTATAMTFGTELPWVQVHTADHVVAEMNRAGLAVEPMTCPPDAFNSEVDLIVLGSGESAIASWTIAAV